MSGYILTNPQWGFLAIPRYPSLWLPEREKAHVFATRRKALKESARWAAGLVKVEEAK